MPTTELILETGGAAGERRHVKVAGHLTDRSLTDLLALHEVPLNARCGQRGWCKGCLVELLEGELTDTDGARVAAGGMVRSCRMRLTPGSRVVLGIPAGARIGLAPQVGETFELNVPYRLDPLFPVADGREVALAVDIGTTTVVVMLVDLTTGTVLSRAGGFNAQIRFGDNVLTRIGAASSPAVRQAMRRALVEETLAPLIATACGRAGLAASRLAGGTLAGNTTMLHILADEDPTSLGIAPFTAVFLEGRVLTAGRIGLDAGLDPALPLQLLPGLSAYVGADITAGVYATGMVYDEAPSLLVDMGTNGEVVLHAAGRLVGCATAAGPAFEGAGLSSGTRAQTGAVETIHLGLDPFSLGLETIGGGPVTADAGICGSAYVDFLATARASGLLQANGRFDRRRWPEVPETHRFESEDGYALRLAADPGPTGGPRVSEVDVAHLLQAKAAIGAGIETLLEVAGLTAAAVGRVYLAGGFGMHIDVRHAIAMGLLPGFTEAQVTVVGNTALGGAILAAIDRAALVEMESLRARIEVVELNLHEGFEDRYIDHLHLTLPDSPAANP